MSFSKDPFKLSLDDGHYNVWLAGKTASPKFFDELLPGCFRRTLEFDALRFEIGLGHGSLEWIFTGDEGGFTVELDASTLQVRQRYYDSFAHYPEKAFFDRHANVPLDRWMKGGGSLSKHPEREWFETTVAVADSPRSITVELTHCMTLRVAVDGEEVIVQRCLLDVHRHHLRLKHNIGEASGALIIPEAEECELKIDETAQRQTIVGFGGTGIATAYAELSEAGRERWWQWVAEYNLLVQRDYPIGPRLREDRSNWETLADATPHYYGDNFPNGNIVSFSYNDAIQRLGGEVWFEFWQFPSWVAEDEEFTDEKGLVRRGGVNIDAYASIMVEYCETSVARTGKPPSIVGIQNEGVQSPADYHAMTLALRTALDKAGFSAVKIHMSDANFLSGENFKGRRADGITRAKTFTADEKVWAAIDYASTHMYDYQEYVYDPDGYDRFLREFRRIIGDKPFISNELAINDRHLQVKNYRLALLMAQLIHKNMTIADAAGVAFCWTLLNVEQPSYGATRSLFVPDRRNNGMPKPSSDMLRVFGAFSRRLPKGMTRVESTCDHPDLLATTFSGEQEQKTWILFNRGTAALKVKLPAIAKTLTTMETVDPYHPNTIAERTPGDTCTVPPGSIITLTNVPLGKLPEGFKTTPL